MEGAAGAGEVPGGEGGWGVKTACAAACLALLAACDPAISTAEQAVRRTLRDPDSAQFRDVSRCERSGIDGVRGEVNAKNSAGGYAGFAYFIAINGDVAILSGLSGGDDVQMYRTPPEHWEALFRQCNSDATNRSVDNASQAASNSALSAAQDASAAAQAASDAASANMRNEISNSRRRAAAGPRPTVDHDAEYDANDPMRNEAPDN